MHHQTRSLRRASTITSLDAVTTLVRGVVAGAAAGRQLGGMAQRAFALPPGVADSLTLVGAILGMARVIGELESQDARYSPQR